jgi:hypothetical protein
MNCLECQQRIQRCLDGESVLSDGDDFATHLVLCANCRDHYAATQCLLDGLRELPPYRPPADLSERICRQILVERTRATQLRRLVAGSGLAASLLLMCCAVYIASRSASKADVRAQSTRVQQAHRLAASRSLHRSFQEAGQAVVALTRRTADETVDQTKLLFLASIPRASFGDAGELEQMLESPAESFREIQEAMSAGLEPVASSARRAVGLFLREIPPLEYGLQ